MNSRSFREKIKALYRNKQNEWDIYGDRQIDPNELTHEDITYFLTLLRNRSPTLLCLANMDLTDQQLLPIIKTLESDTNIQILMLPFNQIGDKGAKAIAELLKKNNTITELILFRNKITDVGMNDIAKALKKNKTLVKLEVFDNLLSAEMMPLFKEVITSHPRIETIVLNAAEPLNCKKTSLKKLPTFYFKRDPASTTSKSASLLPRK